MHITSIGCMSDNYAYLLRAPDSQDAVVVDASQAAPVVRALQAADRSEGYGKGQEVLQCR